MIHKTLWKHIAAKCSLNISAFQLTARQPPKKTANRGVLKYNYTHTHKDTHKGEEEVAVDEKI